MVLDGDLTALALFDTSQHAHWALNRCRHRPIAETMWQCHGRQLNRVHEKRDPEVPF